MSGTRETLRSHCKFVIVKICHKQMEYDRSIECRKTKKPPDGIADWKTVGGDMWPDLFQGQSSAAAKGPSCG